VTDALVIGAGPNGLSAAITLARAGRDVLVLEAADHAGGAVATEELTLPGFKHDTWSSVYPASAASPVFARFDLERHGLRWVQPRYCMAHPLPDGRAAVLSRDLAETVDSLERLAPGDGRRWADFARPYLEHFGALRRTMLGGFPPIRGPAELIARTGVSGILALAKLLLMPASSLGEELFESGGSRAWLYGAAMHGDVPPVGAGSAIAAAYLNFLGHTFGWPSPERGAGRLADALVACLRADGGEVRLNARVERVEVERGRVSGVSLAGGERLSAPLVVADVTPRGLLSLTDRLGERYTTALRRFRYGPSTLKLDWALSGPIPWTAAQARGAGTVHVGGDDTDVLRATAHTGVETLPEQPFLLVGQQSIADPTRAPAGQHTAWAYTHGPHGADYTGHAERMEAQVERFAPGFRDLILARHAQEPADLERRNPNLLHGDVGAGSYTLDQVVFRPVPSLAPYRTPVRGLYLGSASAFPGGAVHGVPGHAAARLALAEARLRRPLARR